MKNILLLFLLFGTSIVCRSQSLKGKVVDAVTGEPLVGANVQVRETGQRVYVELDGHFRVKELRPGSYTIEVTYTGYGKMQQSIRVGSADPQTMLFQLTSEAATLKEASVTTDKRETGARRLERN